MENENLDVDKDIFKNNFIIIQKGGKKYFVVFFKIAYEKETVIL